MRVIKCTRAKKWIFVNRNRCDNIYTRKCRIPHETLSIGTYGKKERKKRLKKLNRKDAGKNKRKRQKEKTH